MPRHLKAELSAEALRHNIEALRRLTPAATRLCPVIKANAYGHGLEALMPALLACLSKDADSLAVTTLREASKVRRLGWEGPLLVFFTPASLGTGPERSEILETLLNLELTYTVATREDVELLARAARAEGRQAEVHLKIDTGMNRSGTPDADAAEFLRWLRERQDVRLSGAYTHFATAESTDPTFAREQLERFLAVVEASGVRDGLVLHAANSAATLALPESHLDLVRPGLATYGLSSLQRGGVRSEGQAELRRPLRPVLRLTSQVAQVKRVAAGARTGYGLKHTFERDTVIGLVPMGYADGYLYALGDRAQVTVRGRPAPVRGAVSMDQIVVDLNGLEEPRIGDEVEIFSPDPAAAHSVESLARLAGTIPYELVCGLGRRIERQLVESHRRGS